MKSIRRFTLWLLTPLMISTTLVSCDNDIADLRSSENEILSVTFNDERVITQPVVSNGSTEFTFIVSPDITDYLFAPIIEISSSASVSPRSGVAADFSGGTLTYTVTAEDGTKKVYRIRCIRLEGKDTRIEEMALAGINEMYVDSLKNDGKDYYFYVKYNTPVEELKKIKPEFTLASATSKVVPEDGEPDFSVNKRARYRVSAENADVYTIYTVTCVISPNTDALITSFTLTGDDEDEPILLSQPELDPNDPTSYFFYVVHGATDEQIDMLQPVIEVSPGASYDIKEGSPETFSEGPVTFVVLAADGEGRTEYTAEYRRALNTEAMIVDAVIEGTVASYFSINEQDKTVVFGALSTVTNDEIYAFRPVFVVSEGATLKTSNENETAYDFFTGVSYDVTSEDKSHTVTYLVTVEREASNTARMNTFEIGAEASYLESPIVINQNGDADGTIDIQFNASAPREKITLTPNIGISGGATVSPASGSLVEFTYGTPVTYTVTAEDGITKKDYIVTVNRTLSTDAQLLGISFEGTGASRLEEAVDLGNNQFEVFITEDSEAQHIGALKWDLSVSDNAIVTAGSGNPSAVELGATYTFTVTAEDGSDSNTYTLTCYKRRYYNFEEWQERSTTALFQTFKYWKTNEFHNANVGTAYAKASGQYSFDNFPTIRTADSHTGDYAAELTTYYTGGSMAPLVAGNMYLGWFNFSIWGISNPLNFTRFGTVFPGKPIKVRGYYKYVRGEQFYDRTTTTNELDEFAMSAVLFHLPNRDTSTHLNGSTISSSNLILATGRFQSSEPQSTYTKFEYPVTYDNPNGLVYNPEELYKFTLVFSPSSEGAAFKGAHGSQLKIDDVEIIYVE